jgi:hypothetical protein
MARSRSSERMRKTSERSRTTEASVVRYRRQRLHSTYAGHSPHGQSNVNRNRSIFSQRSGQNYRGEDRTMPRELTGNVIGSR